MFDRELRPAETGIAGLVLWDLPVHGDSRGWFKENWQRAKMLSLGLPDLGPVQNNVAFNATAGVTRGIHAEPWDKYVSVVAGRVFGAWVDLREGPGFGSVVTAEIDAGRAVFVPRGVGNAYQTLEPGTVYSYLVNDYWAADASYTALNLADETVAIPWPVPLDQAEISDKDRSHPRLSGVAPMACRKILVLGADGQVGRAVRHLFGDGPRMDYATRGDIDLTQPDLPAARVWSDYDTVINAAAYTDVDGAETPHGRRTAWATNVTGVAALARIAIEHRLTLVHISSDYVFDGTSDRPYTETDLVCPLGVYGQTKAAADALVSVAPRHYIVRTSWVIGDGQNFVRTMADLAESGADPRVVADQFGRPTRASDIAHAIRVLVTSSAPYGTFNVTGGGDAGAWSDIAKGAFRAAGHDPNRVRPVTTEQYVADAVGPIAPRPHRSDLDTGKAESIGIRPPPWQQVLFDRPGGPA